MLASLPTRGRWRGQVGIKLLRFDNIIVSLSVEIIVISFGLNTWNIFYCILKSWFTVSKFSEIADYDVPLIKLNQLM